MTDYTAADGAGTKKNGFFVLLDTLVGGAPSDDGKGHFPVYINSERLPSAARVVGGVKDERILEALKTADGLKHLVHTVGVFVKGDLPEGKIHFSMSFLNSIGGGTSRNGIDVTTDGNEHLLSVEKSVWSDADAVPGEFLFELPRSKDVVSVSVCFYINGDYDLPPMKHDSPVRFDTPEYREMIARSLLSMGNTERVKRVLSDLREGKDVTIAFIGGSVTQGANAIPIQENCYARKTYEAIVSRYAKAPECVHYIKAGVGGTPSQLGILRYDRDITRDGTVVPDLVVVEFAVNDSDDETGGVCYESLIRRIWNAPNEPAVILLFAVFADDWNLKEELSPVGFRHELPMVNILDAVVPQFEGTDVPRVIARRQYFYDIYHPTNTGHRIMSDCLMYFLDRADKQQETEGTKDAPPYYGFDWTDVKFFDSACVPGDVAVHPGSFTDVDKELQCVPLDFDERNTPQFPNNWKKGDGRAPFVLEINCRALQMIFKDSSSPAFGIADVIVDGKLVKSYNPHDVGWTHCHPTVLFNNKEPSPHKVEIRMAAGSEDKVFTILGFGAVQ